jgi:formate-dependent phosphoribosylglycinamide formyltransferase (GAR transformylase)
MKKILMIALETERWGPARLPEPMAEAGLQIATFCTEQNPLSQSSFVSRHFPLCSVKSWRTFAAALGKVLDEWKPDLVIACDEPVVVMLHHILKHKRASLRYMSAQHYEKILNSIGYEKQLDAMVLKHNTRLLAESIGVKVPTAHRVETAEQAVQIADAMGYPVYLKKSFSWAGQGAISCNDADAVRAVFQSMHTHTPCYKNFARCLMGRNWYPVKSAIEVQQQIAGDSVMYSVSALRGRVLAGFFANRATMLAANGPSTVVNISEHSACRHAAENMVAAMGASGFLAFDFIRCVKTDEVYLLECNPRPNQICHLGRSQGVDLCGALSAALHGQPVPLATVAKADNVPLFPQEWLRDEKAAWGQAKTLDIPLKDPKLFQFMLQSGVKRGKSVAKLKYAFKKQGVDMPHYTFG